MSEQKEQNSIPTGKVDRATRLVATGVKVGGNYVKHYTKMLLNGDTGRGELNKDNAEDIYKTLSTLKGSALKVAQMLSMDRGMLPKEYVDKFSMAQYSAPPLSAPLVMSTFQKTLGKTPSQLYDKFDIHAANAASIGQVHKAELNGKQLAVKIQYPGVANSVSSDLKIVKPFATRLVGLKDTEMNKYFEEIESKLLEETDYELEVRTSIELSEKCGHIADLIFPRYYPEMSSKRIITMDWLTGQHLKEFLQNNPDQETRNRAGQALWDFYHFQIHSLKKVHADPHPGNFLFQPDGKVAIFDFGCVKEIPLSFYDNYFALVDRSIYENEALTKKIYMNLEMIHEVDSAKEVEFFSGLFRTMIDLFTLPFTLDEFDFGNDQYFNDIYAYTEYLSNLKEIRDSKVARGSRHSLYINRTYFGLYSILNDLKAKVQTHSSSIARPESLLTY